MKTSRRREPPRRGDKRERTRAALIEAAAAVIGERGLDSTSLEEIANRAGMSRGAIYNNFSDKEELFLAVAMSKWTPVMPTVAEQNETPRSRLRAYGKAVADAAEQRRSEMAGAISFVQYALRNEALRRRVEQANGAIYAAASTKREPRGQKRTAPNDVFVQTVHALAEGMMVLHALTPNLITRQVIEAAFESLACIGNDARK
jgi:AcrR family transcriptional regulator